MNNHKEIDAMVARQSLTSVIARYEGQHNLASKRSEKAYFLRLRDEAQNKLDKLPNISNQVSNYHV